MKRKRLFATWWSRCQNKGNGKMRKTDFKKRNSNQVAPISQRLRTALDLSGKNQADLSRETGIDTAAISRYLKGTYAPKSTALYKLALALDVSDMWLAGYDVQMNRLKQQNETDFKSNLHDKIAQDTDLLITISQYYNLPEKKQRIIRELVESMSC